MSKSITQNMNYRQSMMKYVEKYGVSCASLLLNRGFTLKDVQEWMGHSDISVTANIYGHLDIARKQSIADSMTSLLRSDTP